MDVLGNTPRTLKRGHTIIKAKITKQFFKHLMLLYLKKKTNSIVVHSDMINE